MKKIIIVALLFAIIFLLSSCINVTMKSSPENLQSSAIAIIKARNGNENKNYCFQLLNDGTIMKVNVFKIKDRIFVNVELNVNWVSPSDLYEFKKNKLIYINSFPEGTEIEQICSIK